MTRVETRTVAISCEANNCPNQGIVFGDVQEAIAAGWGMVQMSRDGGWTQVDLCLNHYKRLTDLFGLTPPA